MPSPKPGPGGPSRSKPASPEPPRVEAVYEPTGDTTETEEDDTTETEYVTTEGEEDDEDDKRSGRSTDYTTGSSDSEVEYDDDMPATGKKSRSPSGKVASPTAGRRGIVPGGVRPLPNK